MKEDSCICYSNIFAPFHCFNFLTHHAMDILNLCCCWLRSFSLHLECDGLKSNEIVDGTTIDQFRGCNIIASGGLYIGHIPDPNFKWVAIELVHARVSSCKVCKYILPTSVHLSSLSSLSSSHHILCLFLPSFFPLSLSLLPSLPPYSCQLSLLPFPASPVWRFFLPSKKYEVPWGYRGGKDRHFPIFVTFGVSGTQMGQNSG